MWLVLGAGLKMAETSVKLAFMPSIWSPRFHDNSESAQFPSLLESTGHTNNDTRVWLQSVSVYGRYWRYKSAESARLYRLKIKSVAKGLNRSLLVLYPRLQVVKHIQSLKFCLYMSLTLNLQSYRQMQAFLFFFHYCINPLMTIDAYMRHKLHPRPLNP